MTKIGIFDSGVGGLSILEPARRRLPKADFLYLADLANFPFGEKSEAEIRQLVERGLKYLKQQGCDVVVLACNTASVQGLPVYEQMVPDLQIIAVRPLLDEAVALTKTAKVVVLATFATLASDYFQRAKALLPQHITIYAQAAFDWVRMVENDQVDASFIGDQVKAFARHGVDTVVLGCTHFAFLRPVIQAAVGQINIIDPGASIAAELANYYSNQGRGELLIEATDQPERFGLRASKLLNQSVNTKQINL